MDQGPLRVLLVEDNPDDVELMKLYLDEMSTLRHSLVYVNSLRCAVDHLKQGSFDVLLVDLFLPGSQPQESLKVVLGAASHLPVVIITGLNDEAVALEALQKGAQDYLIKGHFDSSIFCRSIRYAIERKRIDEDLKKTNRELRKANEKIIEQQNAVIEEERLKLLLQLAGATAHELNQPLTALLSGIDFMRMHLHDPGRMAADMDNIKVAGKQISAIVKKIQNIRRDETRPYLNDFSIINLDQQVRLLLIEGSPEHCQRMQSTLQAHGQIDLAYAPTMEQALRELQAGVFDIVLLGHSVPDGNLQVLRSGMRERKIDLPVVIMVSDEAAHADISTDAAGAYDYFPADRINDKSILRSIMHALEKFRFNKQLRLVMGSMADMATRDPITGLFNRRYFEEAMEREFTRAKRYDAKLALCMIDVDGLKAVNETYGRRAGDTALSQIGKMLEQHVRKSDLLCRYGGEEFAVILPSTSLENTLLVCERFRSIVARSTFGHSGVGFSLTVSIGIAALCAEAVTRELLMTMAVQALYQAKAAGQNRVVVYGREPVAAEAEEP